ncbi:hypothetical protein HPP92_009450 [Vanilla planifolia]|uniref:Uncharacterized protein n=1 Tax=Vanilla planifolia TaxID=51239 RepID=A0A835R880_VANPL|nr:hypothetical protein HPP92_009450 [Vanilla planifolia]
MHKHFSLAAEVASKLLELEPENPSHYVLLERVRNGGEDGPRENTRDVMISRGWRKQIGYSLVEVDHVAYLFRMGMRRRRSPLSGELVSRIKEMGYAPQTDSVMHDLEEEEEKELALRFHSESWRWLLG